MREHEQRDGTDTHCAARHLSDEAVAAPTEEYFPSPRHTRRGDSAFMRRMDAASRATRMLAFPPAATATMQDHTEDERDTMQAEGPLLSSALRVLQGLALPDASAVLLQAGTTTWRTIAQANDAQLIELDLRETPQERLGNTVAVSRVRHSHLWRALAPWREITPHVEQAVLIPLFIGDELRAIFLLGFADASSIDEGWLPTATAVATSCAAGIEVQRLRQRVIAEAQARDAYISLAAHELRSPITSIKGYAQLLVRQARKLTEPLPEAMTRSVESIEQQSSRMAEMVGELLDASRISRGALELFLRPADLVTVVRTAVERRGRYHPQQTFTFESDVASVPGTWDTARIEQVVRDLLENAARHSPEGSRIATTITREGNLAVVTVRDEGSGVAEDDHERIFEYLYRSPSSVERNLAGLGLGLYVSRHIIERHGGRLSLVASRTDEHSGSTFRFTLPIEPPLTTH